jgi:hypothetical protein
MARKEIQIIKGAVLTVGKQIEENGAGADKLAAFASLVNAYSRLLSRTTSSRKKRDPYADGDPDYHTMLSQEDTDE